MGNGCIDPTMFYLASGLAVIATVGFCYAMGLVLKHLW
jgi:hypothetical protein